MFDEMTDKEIMENADLLAKVFVAHRQAHWFTADPWEMRKAVKAMELKPEADFAKLCRMRDIINAIESIKNAEAENLYDGMLNAESVERWKEAIAKSNQHKMEIDQLAAEFAELNK